MSFPLSIPRKAGLATVTAFGIATLGSIPLAAAHPTTPAPVPAPIVEADDDFVEGDDFGHDRHDARSTDYDLDNDGVLEHVELDYRHYDTDRDGTLGQGERTAYWKHMFDMGKFGGGFTRADKIRLARIAFLFDRDGDGRLTQGERVAISRLIRARRLFVSLDRNRDNSVTQREAGLTRRWNRGNGSGYGNGHYADDRIGGSYDWRVFSWTRARRPESSFRPRNWIAARFDSLDRNDNGRVSWSEMESSVLRSLRGGIRL